MNNKSNYTVSALLKKYRSGELSPREIIEDCFRRIDRQDEGINAFLRLSRKKALERAVRLEDLDPGLPLYGIPVAVKDNICTRGEVTSCGSRILEGYSPPYSATVVKRLEEAGAVVVGKTNMDEFAMGSSCENSAFGPTANPHDTTRAPGGSSGGSAAAVAAEMVPVALGSDTGGSIRQPASFCGVVGFKGTYGRVSRYGLVAFASSLDQIGPITGNVADCAAVMEVIGGHDPGDATTIPEECPILGEELDRGWEGVSVGVPSSMGEWDIDETVREVTENTISRMKESGVEVREIKLPDLEATIGCYYILATAEASSNLARYDGVRYGLRVEGRTLEEMYRQTRGEGFGEEVKRRILLGTYVLSAGYYEAYYARAQKVKALLCDSYMQLFREVDLVLLPTSPTPAFRLGEKLDDPVAMYLSDIFTTTANIAGLPAISIPGGHSPDGLPVGLQLLAGWGGEKMVIRGAAALERMFQTGESPGDNGGKYE